MLIDKENIYDVFVAYINNELTDSDLVLLKAWINASEENCSMFCRMREIWVAIKAESADRKYDSKSAFERFKKETGLSKRQPNRIYVWRYAASIAASITLAIVLLGISYNIGVIQTKNSFADIVIEAPMGSKTHLYLPDNTEVWLNAGSKISYSQGFGVSDRKLSLSGEGYFIVTRNAEMPFWVETKELNLKVLGTTFNIRNYFDDNEAVVTLEQGKVMLENCVINMHEIYLDPNQSCILNKSNGEVTLRRHSAPIASSWTSDRLFFDEENLFDIVKILERAYNVKIEIANGEICNRRFYGDFLQSGTDIYDILDAMCATERINYKSENGTITLY